MALVLPSPATLEISCDMRAKFRNAPDNERAMPFSRSANGASKPTAPGIQSSDQSPGRQIERKLINHLEGDHQSILYFDQHECGQH